MLWYLTLTNYTIHLVIGYTFQKMDGVIAYMDKNDIPGRNTYTPRDFVYPAGYFPPTYPELIEEEIFCSGEILYYYQPVGIIVATTQDIATKAVDLVKISYGPGKTKPFLTCREVLAAGANDKIHYEDGMKAIKKGEFLKF